MNKIINCSILIAGSRNVGSAILNQLNNNLQKEI